jgi:hypothetical protein
MHIFATYPTRQAQIATALSRVAALERRAGANVPAGELWSCIAQIRREWRAGTGSFMILNWTNCHSLAAAVLIPGAATAADTGEVRRCLVL